MTRTEADAALREGLRRDIREHWASMAFMSLTERRPVRAEIRRLMQLLNQAGKLRR